MNKMEVYYYIFVVVLCLVAYLVNVAYHKGVF